VVALVVGIVVTLIVTGGDDTDTVSTGGTRPPSTVTPEPPVTVPPTPAPTPPTRPPEPTAPPPSVVVVPPSTAAPTTPTVPPTASPTVPPTTPPTTPPTVPPTEPPARDPGITDTEIRLAVIADDQDSIDGVQAWVDVVNKKGLAGRKVVLDPFLVRGDAAAYAAAVDTACDRDFAIVGSLSRADGAIAGLDCGIPNLPARALSLENRTATNTYAVVPTTDLRFQVGGFRWLAGSQTGCCRQYVIWSTDPALAAATQQSADAAETFAGFTDAGGAAMPDDAPQSDYAAPVAAMADAGATFGRSDLPYSSTIALRKEAASADLEGVTWFCLAQCYQPGFLQQGGTSVDDSFVQISITPFEDASAVPAMKRYLTAGGPRNQAGVESTAAGLLFQNVVNRVYAPSKDPDAVTRAAVLAALTQVDRFDAGDLIGPTDVAGRVPNGCFVMMRVDGTKFVRAQPTTPGKLDCTPGNLTNPLGP
jgi:hypothetical protein